MNERRNGRRIELSSTLLIKNLSGVSEEISIEISDVSKTGIGFTARDVLTIGTVYEAFLTIWTKEVLHAFLEIVRIEKIRDNLYSYGAIFIGMPEMDAKRIETYDTIDSMDA